MFAVTSISPTHINKDIQSKAVQSWIDLGMEVFSINCKEECDQLKPLYPNVTFVETSRTMELTFGKPYVAINAVLDWCKDQMQNHFCIINSDIELKTDLDTVDRIKKEMVDNIVLANRVNYDHGYSGTQYLLGNDIMFLHRKYLSIYPQTVFCFGQCFWDYWIPFRAAQCGIPITFIKQNIAYHKNHNPQYNNDDWKKIGRYFLWEHNLYQFNDTTEIGRMSTFVYNQIEKHSIRKEI